MQSKIHNSGFREDTMYIYTILTRPLQWTEKSMHLY
jgi:hypothetical protein